MSRKKITFLLFFFTSGLLIISGSNVRSQSQNKVTTPLNKGTDNFENIYLHWFIAMDKTRISNGISRNDFDMFTRFSQKEMDSLRGDFMKRIEDGTVTTANVGQYEQVIINAVTHLFEKYRTIARHYPSSVEEFRNPKFLPPSACDSACNNINFAAGNLSGWNAFYGFNNSGITSNLITNLTGGPAGAVTHAANDVLTSTPGYYNPSVGPTPSPDYQINITSGSRGDALAPSVPVVSPFGGHYSVMLGDSTQVNYGVAILSQTFLVTPSNENFTYQYAVFLANPVHNYYQQPFFQVALLDQLGDTIPHCGEYNVVSGNGTQNFDSLTYTDTALSETFTVYYKNWTIVDVPLKNYVGQCVTIVFESVDCALGGHFGYAYVDASCSPDLLISSSPNLCGQDSISLTAPPGYANYIWSGPRNGILGSSTSQTAWVDSSGNYMVVLVPVTGLSCSDTLYDSVGVSSGPVPKPDFYITSGCAGQTVHFINTSTDTSSAHFYWDFYNIGVYNDSNIIDPTWTYATPGTYTVKLAETYKGCGADTLITISIDSTVSAGFLASGGCAGTPVNTTNTSTGATGFLWNFGDPASGTRDTSSVVSGNHIYGSAGTYTITLIAYNSGACPDTTTQVITINKTPKPVISGVDSLCPNYNDTLSVIGGNTYLWSTGATTSTIIVSAAATDTLSVTAYEGPCSHDTTFIIHVVTPIAKITASKDSVCSGQNVTLSASGGVHYLWSNNSTATSIVVSPLVPTTYTLYATFATCSDSTTITIGILPPATFTLNTSSDSICPGSSATISIVASGGHHNTYKWSNGATTSSITVSPHTTTTYTASVSNGFCSKDTSVSVYVKAAPVLVVSSPDDTICLGQSVGLNVTGAASYTWAPSNGLSCITCPNPTATPTASITYIVIGMDSDGCTSSKNAFILVETEPVLGFIQDQSICSGNVVNLVANELSGFGGEYTWEPGGSHSASIYVTPVTTTTYTVQYQNKCGATDTTVTVIVSPAPVPAFKADITSGCAPLCIQFLDMSTIVGSSIMQWSWQFGDGDSSFHESPIYCYADTGIYSVRLTAVSIDGCSASLQIDEMITVFSKPVANFIFSPNPVNFLDPTVQFTNESTDAYGITYWAWNFEDGSAPDGQNSLENPIHTYPDTGSYCPMLIVTNNKGCVDTNIQCLPVDPIYTLYIPSAFSPNGDGLNEVFEPKGSYIKSFEMYIFDRWGMELYHTTDIHRGWNGTVHGGARISQEDSYVYTITAVDWNNQKHSYVGEFALIK
jgi:gliding motility-associated-like protein